jgi:hypothetical protein
VLIELNNINKKRIFNIKKTIRKIGSYLKELKQKITIVGIIYMLIIKIIIINKVKLLHLKMIVDIMDMDKRI